MSAIPIGEPEAHFRLGTREKDAPSWPVSPPSPRSAGEALGLLGACGAEAVDIRFCDLFGAWQHFTVSPEMLSEGSFAHGFGVDGSSVRGWKDIHESDMLVVPQFETAF